MTRLTRLYSPSEKIQHSQPFYFIHYPIQSIVHPTHCVYSLMWWWDEVDGIRERELKQYTKSTDNVWENVRQRIIKLGNMQKKVCMVYIQSENLKLEHTCKIMWSAYPFPFTVRVYPSFKKHILPFFLFHFAIYCLLCLITSSWGNNENWLFTPLDSTKINWLF